MSRCSTINVNHLNRNNRERKSTTATELSTIIPDNIRACDNQHRISNCFHSPRDLLRQKSFHTLNELKKICHIKRHFRKQQYKHEEEHEHEQEQENVIHNIKYNHDYNHNQYNNNDNNNYNNNNDDNDNDNISKTIKNATKESKLIDDEIANNNNDNENENILRNLKAHILSDNNFNWNFVRAERIHSCYSNNDLLIQREIVKNSKQLNHVNQNNTTTKTISLNDKRNEYEHKHKHENEKKFNELKFERNCRTTATTSTNTNVSTNTSTRVKKLTILNNDDDDDDNNYLRYAYDNGNELASSIDIKENENELIVRNLCKNVSKCHNQFDEDMESKVKFNNLQQQQHNNNINNNDDNNDDNDNYYRDENPLKAKMYHYMDGKVAPTTTTPTTISMTTTGMMKLLSTATATATTATITSTTTTKTLPLKAGIKHSITSSGQRNNMNGAIKQIGMNNNSNQNPNQNQNNNNVININYNGLNRMIRMKFVNDDNENNVDNHNHNNDNDNDHIDNDDNENIDTCNINKLYNNYGRQSSHGRQRKDVGNTPQRNKMSKKQLKLAQIQLDKLTQCNRHLHALFSAVENGHLDKARTILESTDVNVNSINTDGLSALDIAVLSNNRSMTKMLLQYGALEGSQYNLGTKLGGLLKEAESHIQDLNGYDGSCQMTTHSARSSISSIIIGNSSASVTSCTGNEVDKQIGIWERRIKGLRRLMLGWDQARPPDAPASVIVDVIGETSIQVQILEPFDGAIGTKFQVQWSTRADFSNVVGECELRDWRSFHGSMGTQCKINNLTQGRRYFIRASCGNIKGWGDYRNSVPASIIPSSWRDLNNREDRFTGRQQILDNLFTAVRLARPADVSELTLESQMGNQQKKNPKKKTIKQLFSVASKFQKHIKRGIHLASIVYCEDKVLVTGEEFLPVIEIDESYPASTLYSDYHWLMKVGCSWEDVKSLRSDMERNLTSANQFRIKLLTAVCQMQSALGLNDLGQLYYKPLKDSHGTCVITTIHNIKNQKAISILNSRWLPINKLQKKAIALHEEYSVSEMLVSSLSDQIKYNQTALQPLSPGLYLGYLKMQCSMDQIQVVVPIKTPNVLPHYKVRDNYYINAEEWLILRRFSNNLKSSTIMDVCHCSPLGISLDPDCSTEAITSISTSASTTTATITATTTEVQRLFLYDLSQALQKLLHHMNVRSEETNSHRLYDLEVIEYSKDISFLIICPAAQLTCSIPGQTELLLQREDLTTLSVQSFEMIHLRTYYPSILEKYARLSCILELDTTLANQSHREAFANSELKVAKERLAKLQELTNSLNTVWKSVRWLMDVIAFARDKNAPTATTIKEILEFAENCSETLERKSQFLQPPLRDVKFHKAGTGRGSWPGPTSTTANEGVSNNFKVEYSKSEQNLGVEQQKASIVQAINKEGKQQANNHNTGPQDKMNMASSFLQINQEFANSDNSIRKRSADSISSQYMARGVYCSAINTSSSAMSTTTPSTSLFTIPPSRSEDALAETKRSQKSLMQRKYTSSNIVTSCSTPVTPMIAGLGSRSVPVLGMESTHSLKSDGSSECDNAKELCSTNATNVKVKSISTASLQERGSMSLKTTLTSIQNDIKTAIPITIGDRRAVPSVLGKGLERQSSNIELSTISCPSLSSGNQGSMAPSSGIIQVYTAYNTGLATGTSLKLHVTAKTTSREIINLVVKQLNMATALKGNNGPIYSTDMLDNFCLVAVIGARERCLRDDFKPLLLQNPWRKGRLYVRQKHELLAAIDHSTRKSQLI